MKLFSGIGPNPKLVRMFLAEKSESIEIQEIDLMAGENRQSEFLKHNPAGELPALQLDNGTVIAETIPICEYLEEIFPEPSLFGSTSEQRAVNRMWARRIDMKIILPMTNGFRYSEGLGLFESRMHCIPAAADDLKHQATLGLQWLEEQISEDHFIAGDSIGIADIALYVFLEFGKLVGQGFDSDTLPKLKGWYERIAARPSVEISKHPSEG